VLFLARLEAGQRGADAVEIEDLTVALIVEDQGGFLKGVSALPAHRNTAAQADPWPHRPFLPPDLASDLLARVEALCPRSQPVWAASDMPVSEGVKRAFAEAADLRDKLRQSRVEPLHLLAAIARDEPSRAAQILTEAGVTREKLVNAIREEATVESKDWPVAERTRVAVGRPVLSTRTGAVNFLAYLRARTRGSGSIEVEDLLVALLIEDQGGFLDAISLVPGVGIDISHLPRPHRPFLPRELANDLLARVEGLCSRSQPLPPGADVQRSEGVKRAFAEADLLRDELRQSQVAPLHILAAILGDKSSRGAQALREAGITRQEILGALRGEP